MASFQTHFRLNRRNENNTSLAKVLKTNSHNIQPPVAKSVCPVSWLPYLGWLHGGGSLRSISFLLCKLLHPRQHHVGNELPVLSLVLPHQGHGRARHLVSAERERRVVTSPSCASGKVCLVYWNTTEQATFVLLRIDTDLCDIIFAVFAVDGFNRTDIQAPKDLWAGVDPQLVPEHNNKHMSQNHGLNITYSHFTCNWGNFNQN